MELTEPFEVTVVVIPHRRGRTDSYLLALHGTELLCDTHFVYLRTSRHLLPYGYDDAARIGCQHDREDARGQLAAFQIEAQREYHRHRDDKDRPAFEHVGEGIRVLQRMRRVHAEITAAVRTELLDGDDGCRRSLRNLLRSAFQRRKRLLAVEGHGRTVYHEQDTHQQRQRHQDTGNAAGQVYPEVPYRLGRLGCHTLEYPGQSCHTARGRDELDQHDDEQLGKVAQTGFPAVMLEVAVDHERYARIECLVGRLTRIAVRIQRQPSLTHEQYHTPYEPEQVHGQQRFQELLPVHLAFRVDAADLIDKTFYGGHEIHDVLLPLVHLRNVASQRIAEHYQAHPLQYDA